MVTSGNNITAADINSIITKVNNETTRRVTGAGAVSSVSAGNNVASSSYTAMVARNVSSNAVHCYCQSSGGSPAIVTHKGGVSLSLTAVSGDFDAGDSIGATSITKIDTDATNLAAQCNCNSYGQTCGAQCVCNATNCTCNINCSCNNVCGCNNVCTCHYNCSCNGVCSCNLYCTCNNVCSCQTYCYCNKNGCKCAETQCMCNTVCSCYNNCTCVSQCTCETNSTTSCTCNNQVTCASNRNYTCTCNTNCGCNYVCSCEFGG